MTPQFSNVAIGLIIFFSGVFVGYVLHDFLRRALMMNEDSSKNLLTLIVCISWFLSVLYSLINPSYSTPLEVHGIMGVVVGFFFYRQKQKEGGK